MQVAVVQGPVQRYVLAVLVAVVVVHTHQPQLVAQ
jgi:hypothetical protein